MPSSKLYGGSYTVRRNRLVASAYGDQSTKCWRCGLTLAQHEPHKNGKPATWTAGHVRDGDVTSPLAPEASTCNYRAGAVLQQFGKEPSSRAW
jgi:hypothetical protein